MKIPIKIRPLACGLLVTFLTGCVGYNNTLFMTQSNAGLDLSAAAPPTAEISISRKEGVIAPAFEGGQTPPVVASFKPTTGAGAGVPFNKFLLGVDQTFAGGDAAATMSYLYDAQTGTSQNSAMPLTNQPYYKTIFGRKESVPDGRVRPFVFGTDTLLGLKIAWSGAGGQFPDSVKAGFNRKELALAPVNISSNTVVAGCETNVTYHAKMPSFLATIDSKIKGDKDTARIEALQYFATGESATLLAIQKDVRLAMLARLDPNREAFEARFRTGASRASRTASRVALQHFYTALRSEPANSPSKQRASELAGQLDGLALQLLPASYGFTSYTLNSGNLVRGVIREGAAVPKPNFRTLVQYWELLDRTERCLHDARKQPGVLLPDGTPATASFLDDELNKVVDLLVPLKDTIQSSTAISETIEYFVVTN